MIPPIFIAGAARSGTSMVAKIINDHGAFGGDMQGGNAHNPLGYFENLALRTDMTKPLLRSIGADPMAQDVLPTDAMLDRRLDDQFVDAWRRGVMEIFRRQGYQDGTPWFIKDPKMCLIWRLWHRAFPDAKWLLVQRDDVGNIDVLMNTGFMRKRRTRGAWQEWLDVHKRRLGEILHACNAFTVDSGRIAAGNIEDARSAVEHCGLTWNRAIAEAAVRPELWVDSKTNG